MNPSRIFIDRPVATGLLTVAVLLLGLAAFRLLPASALPDVDYPTIEVETFYSGASSDAMTSAVTAPLERQFGQIPSLTVPLSLVGALAVMRLCGFSLDNLSLMAPIASTGFVIDDAVVVLLLSGIVKRNAILMVDFALVPGITVTRNMA